MKLTTSSAELKRVLKKLSFVEAANIQIDTMLGLAIVSDSELSVVVKSKDFVTTNGEKISIPIKQLSSVVSSLSGGINFDYSSGSLVIESGKTKYNIPVGPSGKLTSLPSPPKKQISLPLDTTVSLLSFASSVVEKRNTFDFSGSVLLTNRENNLESVGTDKRRLAIALASAAVPDLRLLIPLKAAQAVQEMNGKTINVSETENALFFQTEDTMIIARKLSDNFPDFESLVPRSFSIEANIKVLDMKEALKRVASMKDEGSDTTSVTMKISGETLQLLTGNSTDGTAKDEIDIEVLKPDPLLEDVSFTAKVNHKYLTEFFNLVNGTVFFGGVDSTAPVWFKAGNFKLLATTIS